MRLILITLLLLLALAPGVGAAQLVVGVEDLDYLPAYCYRDGEYGGAAREILDAWAADRGHGLTYRPLPVKRLMTELVNGGIDLKFPDNPYWGADIKGGRKVAYSLPVIAYVDGVMVRPERRGLGLEKFQILGTVAGFTPYAWLDRLRAGQVQLKETARMDQLLRQGQAGRVDGVYVSVAVAIHQMEKVLNMADFLVFDSTLPHSRDYYMLSSAAKPDLIADFNGWFSANQERVRSIKTRWGAEKGL